MDGPRAARVVWKRLRMVGSEGVGDTLRWHPGGGGAAKAPEASNACGMVADD